MSKTGNLQPYSGYHARPSCEENVELTHVERGSPAGEYLRRFWHPIALSSELKDAPKLIRVLGEDLVLFRDKRGQLGLLHRRCSHRGTSLEYGIISDRGLRCAYHGWLYAVDGTVLETPSEQPGSRLKETVCHGAYRTHEYSGLIFAYMGPPEEQPAFPVYDSLVWPEGNEIVPYKLEMPCNWLQAHENGADPIHAAYLHAIVSGVQFSPAFGALPVLDFIETPIGLLSVAIRRCGDNLWIRASDVILPNAAQFGTAFVDGTKEKFALCAWLTRWIVPIDNTHCWAIGFRHFNSVIDPGHEGRRDMIGLGKVDFMGQTDERPYEDRQRSPGDWDALVAQGKIAIHANEHLCSTDKEVVLVRRQLRTGIRAIQNGQPLPAPRRYGEKVVPTYNNETILKVPFQGERDGEAMQAFGRGVCQAAIETEDLPLNARRREVECRVRQMIATGAFNLGSLEHAGAREGSNA